MTNETVRAALLSLRQSQLPSGGFTSFSSPTLQPFQAEKTYRTTFVASLIGLALSELEQSRERDTVLQGVARFLKNQASPDSTYNYWAKGSAQRHTMPYPDDLDDTFCALAALSRVEPSSISGVTLANAAKILIAAEIKAGGPYRTWLVDPTKAKKVWRDVDLAVNANVGYFLLLHGISLPGVNRLIEKAIAANRFGSPYYPTEFPVIYFVSRLYRGRLAQKLIGQIVARARNGHWGTPQNTALMVSSLLRLGYEPSRLVAAVTYLRQSRADGCWQPESFCCDPSLNSRPYYAGSPELTAALCLEALSLHQRLSAAAPTDRAEERFFAAALKERDAFAATLPKPIGRDFLALSNKLIAFDRQIVLLPYWFQQALKPQHPLTSRSLIRLALANLCGWIAYTVYDDFLDNEGRPETLPLANVCLRQMTTIFGSVKNRRFQAVFKRIMDRLDSANHRETTGLREDPQKALSAWKALRRPIGAASLAEKSLGHCLAPMAVLFETGQASQDDVNNTELLFRCYLSARQRNDDAHDWEEDLLAGRVTLAITHLCADAAASARRLPAKLAAPVLKEVFWRTTVRKLMQASLRELNQAERLAKNGPLKNPGIIIEKILRGPRRTAERTLHEQRTMTEFLGRFRVK